MTTKAELEEEVRGLEYELFEAQEILDKQDEQVKVAKKRFSDAHEIAHEAHSIVTKYFGGRGRRGSPEEKLIQYIEMLGDILEGRPIRGVDLDKYRYSANTNPYHTYSSIPPASSKIMTGI